jgi:hypothetical protein
MNTNFCCIHPSLLASVDVTELQTTEACYSLDRTNIKYSIFKQSREENLKVMEQTKPKSLCIQKIQNQHDFENIILNQGKHLFP